jgi:hypothetical protein
MTSVFLFSLFTTGILKHPKFVGKHERKRHTNRCEDRIKMDLKEIVFEVTEWINLPQGRVQCPALLNTVLKLQFPQETS